MIIVSKLFFVTYVATYFYSIAQYYIKTISFLLPFNWFLSIILMVFFGITTLFYIVGTTSFLIDSAEHLEEKVHKNKKWTDSRTKHTKRTL